LVSFLRTNFVLICRSYFSPTGIQLVANQLGATEEASGTVNPHRPARVHEIDNGAGHGLDPLTLPFTAGIPMDLYWQR